MNCLPSSRRKNEVYVMTLVERSTRCIVGWAMGEERREAVLQAIVDIAPQALIYFSYSFPTYDALTYSVEGNNADLRHF
jgi:IS1 family transposase